MPATKQVKTKGFMIKVTQGLHEAAIAYSKREQIPVAVLIRELLKVKLGYGDQQAEQRSSRTSL